MKYVYHIIRVLLGVMMIGSGIFMFVVGGFPTEYANVIANQHMDAMEATKYFVPMLAIVKIVCGLTFITRRFMPLGLIVFASVSFNMVIFHIALEPVTGVPAYFIFAMNIFLMFCHLDDYKALLHAKSSK